MKRKEIKARTITQDNDTSCFGCPYRNQSKHNKQAKRHSNRIRRRILIKEMEDEIHQYRHRNSRP